MIHIIFQLSCLFINIYSKLRQVGSSKLIRSRKISTADRGTFSTADRGTYVLSINETLIAAMRF